MRYARLLLVLLTTGMAVAQDARPPAADCTFHAVTLRSPRDTFHQLSLLTESLAPSGRRRPGQPPTASTPPAPRNFIDSEIFGKMVRDGVQWTTRSSDAEFLRRVTLDLTGEIPDADTVRAFLADTDADKRDKAIDRLLSSPAFADRWTMWFGDHVQNTSIAKNTTLTTGGRDAYRLYIHDSIASGKPYDAMVRELIAGNGRAFTDGEANYYVRQMQSNGPFQDTYDNLAAFTGQKFLGLPMVCLSCHNGLGHLELVNMAMAKRKRTDFWAMSAFFAQSAAPLVGLSGTQRNVSEDSIGEYRLDTNWGNKTPRVAQPGAADFVAPAFFLTGEQPQPGERRRVALARMLTAHPQFARASVNYIWKEIFGAGIVEPADSFDLTRQDPATLPAGAVLQPTHPELLDELALAFRDSGYDLRTLLRLIVRSNAYQLSAQYAPGNWSEAWTPYYARHYARRMLAEEVLDAIFKATNVGGVMASTAGPIGKAMALPDTMEGGAYRSFLNNFGRGNRDDDDRTNDSSILQALGMLNDPIVTSRVSAGTSGSLAKKLSGDAQSSESVVEALYLATLSRYPTAEEKADAVAWLRSGEPTRRTEDLQFALINSVEFLFN